jgi:hypothetical protein
MAKFLYLQIPIIGAVFSTFIFGNHLIHGIHLGSSGTEVEAECISHKWEDEDRLDPIDQEMDIYSTEDVAYPTVAFSFEDSIYSTSIAPYYDRQKQCYLITGGKITLLIDPENPNNDPKPSGHWYLYWQAIIPLVGFILLGILIGRFILKQFKISNG